MLTPDAPTPTDAVFAAVEKLSLLEALCALDAVKNRLLAVELAGKLAVPGPEFTDALRRIEGTLDRIGKPRISGAGPS